MIISLERCASTNDEALERAVAGAPVGTVVVAREQTRGRGRLGKTWHSPAGENLTASFIMRPPGDTAQVPPMTLAAGLAVCEAVEGLGVQARLKWPNDLLVGRNKLAGLLTEMRTQGGRVTAVVVGLGLNVNSTTFPDGFAATSLAREAGKRFELTVVLAALVPSMKIWMDRYAHGGVAAVAPAWRERALLGPVTYDAEGGGSAEGVAEGLAPDGGLEVCKPDGTIAVLHSGSISMRWND